MSKYPSFDNAPIDSKYLALDSNNDWIFHKLKPEKSNRCFSIEVFSEKQIEDILKNKDLK